MLRIGKYMDITSIFYEKMKKNSIRKYEVKKVLRISLSVQLSTT